MANIKFIKDNNDGNVYLNTGSVFFPVTSINAVYDTSTRTLREMIYNPYSDSNSDIKNNGIYAWLDDLRTKISSKASVSDLSTINSQISSLTTMINAISNDIRGIETGIANQLNAFKTSIKNYVEVNTTFIYDPLPTEGSPNLVTSGSVYQFIKKNLSNIKGSGKIQQVYDLENYFAFPFEIVQYIGPNTESYVTGDYYQYLVTTPSGSSTDYMCHNNFDNLTVEGRWERVSIGGEGGGDADLSNYYTKAQVNALINSIPDEDTVYTAGTNIQINDVTKVISATDTTYTAGDGIKIENNVISVIPTETDLSDYYNKTEVEQLIEGAGIEYTAGNGITIENNVISSDIPSQENADWDAIEGATMILNKPTALSDFSADSTHRTVTDAQIQGWDNKLDDVLTSVQYLQTNSLTQPNENDAGWGTLPSELANGTYLWTKTKFSDNNIAYNVSKTGYNSYVVYVYDLTEFAAAVQLSWTSEYSLTIVPENLYSTPSEKEPCAVTIILGIMEISDTNPYVLRDNPLDLSHCIIIGSAINRFYWGRWRLVGNCYFKNVYFDYEFASSNQSMFTLGETIDGISYSNSTCEFKFENCTFKNAYEPYWETDKFISNINFIKIADNANIKRIRIVLNNNTYIGSNVENFFANGDPYALINCNSYSKQIVLSITNTLSAKFEERLNDTDDYEFAKFCISNYNGSGSSGNDKLIIINDKTSPVYDESDLSTELTTTTNIIVR